MNNYATNIAIGGLLETSKLPGLLQAAVHCGTALDWNGDRLTDDADDLECLRDVIVDAKVQGEPLRLYNDTAGGGRLEALENFCRDNGLSYRREHDPDHGDTGMVCWWMPGMSTPTEREADAGGEPFVYVREVMEILELLNTVYTPKVAVTAIHDLMKRATPFDVTTLTLRDA